jgi:RNA polymerase sigma factor for flagellar operon FliA
VDERDDLLGVAGGVVASGGVYVPPHALLALHDGGAPAAPTVALTPRQRDVLRMHYDEGRTLREIGERLGVTESRVSQIHSEAVGRLRALLAENDNAQP